MGLNQSLTATGASRQTQARTGAFAVTGTFVGTVQLQRKIQGTWHSIVEYTEPTAQGDETVFDNGVKLFMRFNVTAYTSGTLTVTLE